MNTTALALSLALTGTTCLQAENVPPSEPTNILFVFADEWRAQTFGYAGDTSVRTPNFDKFAAESVKFTTAVSCCPVCTPYRASLFTGMHPLSTGVFVNDQCLSDRYKGPFLAQTFAQSGYETLYVGKWHIDGHGRSKFVPPERRLGFQTWWGYECTHNYNKSYYYIDEDTTRKQWEGYDAFAQTHTMLDLMAKSRDKKKPFLGVLSWGPPHFPYETAPEKYQKMYDAEKLPLPASIPETAKAEARKRLAGYYAHCTALDDCWAELMSGLKRLGLDKNTVVIFSSDHGDLIGEHDAWWKQYPFDESILVPLLVRDPRRQTAPCTVQAPIGTPDLMPTMLGLANIPVPQGIEGKDWSKTIRDNAPAPDDCQLITCYLPFHGYPGREYRGLRTEQFTYVADRSGPWLLFDNKTDPLQTKNLVANPESAEIVKQLDAKLRVRLARVNDTFEDKATLLQRFNIRLNSKGDVFYE
jgi:arylsulfatase A-like enzyme